MLSEGQTTVYRCSLSFALTHPSLSVANPHPTFTFHSLHVMFIGQLLGNVTRTRTRTRTRTHTHTSCQTGFCDYPMVHVCVCPFALQRKQMGFLSLLASVGASDEISNARWMLFSLYSGTLFLSRLAARLAADSCCRAAGSILKSAGL